MKTKLVKVPKKEAYYFCKRVFFSMFGDVGCCFADTLDDLGWVGYPYYKDSEVPNLLLFAKTKEGLNNAIKVGNNPTPNSTKNNIKTIVTDLDEFVEVDEIIDISNLEDYYKTELSLRTFIDNYLLK